MKRYFDLLKKNWLVLLIILIIGFLTSFIITDIYNKNNAYYEASFEVSEISKFDTNKLVDDITLNEVKATASKYDNIDVEKMLEKGDFSYTNNGNIITIITKYEYYDEFFLSSSNSISNRAKTFIKDLVAKISPDDETFVVTYSDPKNIVTLKNYTNKWYGALFGLTGILVIELIVFSILYSINSKILETPKDEYDSKEIYRTCFHKSYWKEAIKPLTKVKDITTIALFFAMMLVCKLIPIPSGFGNLGLSFTYLFFGTVCMIYGPVYGFVIGIFSDVIGFFLPNSGGGAFSLGYTLQAAFTGFIYGICFYKTKVTFGRVLLARILVNILMNAVYGSFLFIFVTYFNNDAEFVFADFMQKVNAYMLLLALPKNVLYLLPQSIFLYYVIRLFNPILIRFKLISKKTFVKSILFKKENKELAK